MTKTEILSFWQRVRFRLIKSSPDFLTRIETAYLATFLASENLSALTTRNYPEKVLLAPRNLLAVWLPGNVSVLGPLTFALLTLANCPAWLKTASGSEALTLQFFNFAKTEANDKELNWLNSFFRVEAFDRSSPKSKT